MRLFCINMKDATDRRRHCESHFAAHGLDVTFVTGFPARQCSIRHVVKSFSLGMVGCYITHERLLEEMVRNNYDLTVIMEDDIHLSENFSDFLGSFHAPGDWDIAFIGWYTNGNQPVVKVDDMWDKVIDGPGHAWGTHCYAVNGKKGAENILKILHPMNLQVDVQITTAMKRGQLKGLLLRNPVAHQGGFKSQVQGAS